jgi:hypothetical protein
MPKPKPPEPIDALRALVSWIEEHSYIPEAVWADANALLVASGDEPCTLPERFAVPPDAT